MMNFSATIPLGAKAKWSESGKFLASISSDTLLIRETESMELAISIRCEDDITAFQWSPNSQYMLCLLGKINKIQVWCLNDESFTCTINCEFSGISSAMWTPDNKHIITFENHSLRLNIWSLYNDNVYYINYPKFSSHKSVKFDDNNQYMAVLETDEKNNKDYISIYDATSLQWQQLSKIPLTKLNNCVDFSWSPQADYICAWDNNCNYNLSIYSILGDLLGFYTSEFPSMGIRTVKWRNNSKELVVGGYDDILVVLSYTTWKPKYIRDIKLPLTDKDIVIYAEDELEQDNQENNHFDNNNETNNDLDNHSKFLKNLVY